ncbi:MAG: CoA-transferase [Candidatus Methanomethylicia archaeon]
MEYTKAELMVVAASRELRDYDVVFVGIGLPNLAANLAKRTHAPHLVMIYESGVIGANPTRVPISIGDPCLVSGSQSVCSIFDVFAFYLQSGKIDVGFLEGAQVDKYGNINTTVIGEYVKPKVRLPGSGGGCDIASLAKRILIIMPHEARRFPEKVDFITSPGFLRGKWERKQLGLKGGGPVKVITDLAILGFDEGTGEMILESIHPGVTVEDVKKNTGWDLKISRDLKTTENPSEKDLLILRRLDPKGVYLRK